MAAANAGIRILGAATLAVLVALWSGVGWAQQGVDSNGETERLLSQKALMLEAYLESRRVSEALSSGEPKYIEAVERARADLSKGAKALEKGNLKRAEQSLDAGLREVSTLVLRQGARAQDPARKREDFKTRRLQINSLIQALEAGGDSASVSPWIPRLAVAKKRLEQADALFQKEKFAEANLQLVSIYEDVVVIVSEARRNQSIVYRLDFDTPADEYAYELERNKSYEILLDIAVAQKENPDTVLRSFIRKLVIQSQELREKAKGQAANGDHVKAIGTLEEATRHLVRALRSCSIMVME